MSGEQPSDGERALHAWAVDAAAKVRGLIPALGSPPFLPRDAYDGVVAELALLDDTVAPHDHNPALRAMVTVWHGGALAVREIAGHGDPAGRALAERLLREVRDPATARGAGATVADRQWAAYFLITVLSPLQSQPGGLGQLPDLSAFVEWAAAAGPAGVQSLAREIEALTAEASQLPELAAHMAEVLRERDTIVAEQMTAFRRPSMPPGSALGSGAAARVGDPGVPPGAGAQPGDAGGAGAAGGRAGERMRTLEEIRRFAAAFDATGAATRGLGGVLDGDDPHRGLNDLLGRLRAVQDQPPPGFDPTAGLEAMRVLLLAVSPAAGGSRQDADAARAHLADVGEYLGQLGELLPPGVDLGDLTVMGRTLDVYSRVMHAREREDVPILRALLAEAEALEAEVAEDQPLRFMTLLALGAACAGLGLVTDDLALLRRGVPYVKQGMAAMDAAGLPFAAEMPRPYLPDLDLLADALAGDASSVHERAHVPPPPGASMEDLYLSALALASRYGLSHERTDLERLVAELERVRDGVQQGRGPRIAADALWKLAEAYREREMLIGDPRDATAVRTAHEALDVLAADVLLQNGAEDGLLTARTGASRGVTAAVWACSQGMVPEAVRALEAGRAMVLHAASVTSSVPERLVARGYHDLAAEWRAHHAAPEGVQDVSVPAELSNTLRRRALEALGFRGKGGEGGPVSDGTRAGGLPGAPRMTELAAGVAESGADAFFYLVTGTGGPGIVLGVAPRVGMRMWVRPELGPDASGPLEHYLDATAARDTARAAFLQDPAAERAWEDALGELCDWAYQVLAPVIDDVAAALADAGGPPTGPPRCVLVPCGRLGIVPWHAARAPRTGGDGGTPDAPRGYLCGRAVISYAASATQFLRVLRRTPRDPAARPVLLADPSMELVHAEVEVMALREAFYGRARLLGELYAVPEEESGGAGTPQEVLDCLAHGASLLHIASHGSAGPNPTVSALHLAPSGDPESGSLTVSRLLDQPEGRAPDAGGPLVVLSACETDLSTRDHDEALTLTTAFVAAGACDVVGSRWTAQDSATALLMAVFHHHLTVGGLAPVDALRAAQLWMLDPQRTDPGSLPDEVKRLARRPDLDRIALWGAFIHQGRPGPAPTGRSV